MEARFQVPDAKLFRDLRSAVLDDLWMFTVLWGEQRTGKSTLALWCVYFLWRMLKPELTEDELWQRVYNSCVFNLSQVIYKMRSPTSPRVWDMKHLHNRVPVLLWDDFGAHSNKAVTQHELAWDYFKGGFDVLGTKVAIIIVTMTTPEQPTSQIEHKYTHEIKIMERGVYKYDKVVWQQDFRGWNAKHSKFWQQTQRFSVVPMTRFLEYDGMRQTLADEVLVKIQDAMSQKIPWILKRTHDCDLRLLERILNHGPIGTQVIYRNDDGEAKEMVTRLKAHQLVISNIRKGHPYLDITDLGLDVLKEWRIGEEAVDRQERRDGVSIHSLHST